MFVFCSTLYGSTNVVHRSRPFFTLINKDTDVKQSKYKHGHYDATSGKVRIWAALVTSPTCGAATTVLIVRRLLWIRVLSNYFVFDNILFVPFAR